MLKRFEYKKAGSIDEAESILSNYQGKAKIISGGTDLIGTLRNRIFPTYPEVVVDINHIADLAYIKEEADTLRIGALTKLDVIDTDPLIKQEYSCLSQAAHAVGTPQLRNMGTIGGNLCQDVRCWYFRASNNYFYCFRKGGTLCNAVPGDNRYNAILGGAVCFAVCPSDTSIALTALSATVVTNKRSIPIADFFQVLGHVLDDDEIVVEVQVPQPKTGVKQQFSKFRIRKALDFAMSSVAIVAEFDGANVSNSRIVLGGVAPTPHPANAAEGQLQGKTITDSVADEVATASVKGAMALSKNGYLIALTKGVVRNAVLSLAA